ncbi:response regulator [Kineosporia sp. R_H_3]|uniref:response regulator n=1 Tax=Kineosporia sp. R_H_3 TaxID=1961848 RepID=UPI000B4B503D|nr:response regulator [Kineosporia sp. R_H_3]
MTKVLVVDDEPALRRTLAILLRARGYEVVSAADGRGGLAAVPAEHPDVVVLDLGLPDVDGVDVVRSLRGWSPVPILVLSGRLDARQKVAALDAGADDYVTKPFDVEELLARLRAVARRHAPSLPADPVRLGRFTVDVEDRTARADDGTTVHLTPTQWGLLEMLVRSPGRLVGQRTLLREVWGPTYEKQTHYLRQYMKQLRDRLEDDPSNPRHLVTDPGLGYRFVP